MKKIDRGDFTQAEAQQQLADELADVQTYLDILAMRLGVELDRAVIDKFNRVSERAKAGVRLEADDWYYDKNLGDVPESVAD